METNQFIDISEAAQQELARLSKSFDEHHLIRIGVKGGGCSGLTYILDETLPDGNDHILDFNGVKIAVNQAHALYLQGVRLDFGTGLDNRGFIFENPNASSTCGCGTSFAV